MKVTVSSFDFIRNPGDKKRIIPEKGGAQVPGIKTYGKVMGWLHSHFGSGIELKDSHHVWYVKRGDLQSWAESLGAPKGFDLKQLGQVLDDLRKPVNIIIEDMPGRTENGKKLESKEKPSSNADAEFHKAYWELAKKLHPDKAELIDNYDKDSKKALNETEIGALMLVVTDLKNNPNKTEAEKQQLKEFSSRLDNKAGEKINELDNYIQNLKIESKKEIGPAVIEWMKKYQATAKLFDLELSKEKELSIVNNAIEGVSKAAKNPDEVLKALLSRHSLDLAEKLNKKIHS